MHKTTLIADLGGTNARFAIGDQQRPCHIKTYASADYSQLLDSLNHYLLWLAEQDITTNYAIFAIAAPIQGHIIQFTNSHWHFNATAIEARLGHGLKVYNDFYAQALALESPNLQLKRLYTASASHATPATPSTRLVIGPGTGLGVAYLTDSIITSTEAGHITLPSRSALDFAIFSHLQAKFGHVRAETVCSGHGLENLYAFFSQKQLAAPAIYQAAMAGDHDAKAAVTQFIRYFGHICGQLALAVNSLDGLYLAGGIPKKIAPWLQDGPFLSNLWDHGQYSNYLQRMPVWMVTEPEPALLGLALLCDKI